MSDSDQVRKGIVSAENRIGSTFVMVEIMIISAAAGFYFESFAAALAAFVISTLLLVFLAAWFALFIFVILGTAIYFVLDGTDLDDLENFAISFFISGMVATLHLASARTLEEESDIT